MSKLLRGKKPAGRKIQDFLKCVRFESGERFLSPDGASIYVSRSRVGA